MALAPAGINGQCNYYQAISPGVTYQVFSPNYPGNYPAGLACTWTAEAPVGYKLELSCPTVVIPSSTGCSGDRMSVNIHASSSTATDNVYCGTGTINLQSSANALIIRLRTVTNNGRFFCTMKTVVDHCNCGRRRTVSDFMLGVSWKINLL